MDEDSNCFKGRRKLYKTCYKSLKFASLKKLTSKLKEKVKKLYWNIEINKYSMQIANVKINEITN